MFNIIYFYDILSMNIPANIISFIHLLVILFVINTPLVTDNPFILLYYCFIVFFIMIHWHYNNDTCVLTLIESKLRGKKDNETYFGRLIKPIYNVSSSEVQYITLFLFMTAFLKTRFWEEKQYNYLYYIISTRINFVYNKLINSNVEVSISE
jgi:hypothetical protein